MRFNALQVWVEIFQVIFKCYLCLLLACYVICINGEQFISHLLYMEMEHIIFNIINIYPGKVLSDCIFSIIFN